MYSTRTSPAQATDTAGSPILRKVIRKKKAFRGYTHERLPEVPFVQNSKFGTPCTKAWQGSQTRSQESAGMACDSIRPYHRISILPPCQNHVWLDAVPFTSTISTIPETNQRRSRCMSASSDRRDGAGSLGVHAFSRPLLSSVNSFQDFGFSGSVIKVVVERIRVCLVTRH